MPASSATFNKTNCNSTSSSTSTSKRKPFLFLTNFLRRKKVLEIDDIVFDREMNYRARSEPSGEWKFFKILVLIYSCLIIFILR